MKLIKSLFLLFVIALGVALFLAMRPVPTPGEEECLVQTGIVLEIYEGNEKDVIIKLNNTQRVFYINRGLDNGLVLDELNEQLSKQEVVIKYPDYWTPLDPNQTIRHISKLQMKGQTIFSEID